MYDNKVLDCKVSLHHTDYITSSLNNIREPKKIFVDKIAKRVTKSDLEKSFMVYGEIEEIILIEKEKRSINFAYISYFDTESARRCVQGPEIKYSAGSKLSVIFARPKFSKKMLLDIPPLLKEYIRQIQKGLKEYDPKDFVNLQLLQLLTKYKLVFLKLQLMWQELIQHLEMPIIHILQEVHQV